MYARITRMTMDPSRYAEAEARLAEIADRVGALPGLTMWVTTGDRESGAGYAVAVYDSKESAEAAAGAAQELLGGFAEFMTSSPEVVLQEVTQHLFNG